MPAPLPENGSAPPEPAPPATETVEPFPEAAVANAEASADPETKAPHAITAVEGFEKIRSKPQWDAPFIGLIRAGQSVAIKEGPLTGPTIATCAGGWFAVEPRGFVCVGPGSTLAAEDPRALAAAEILPRASDEPFHYGVSLGAPRYLRIPTRAEQRQSEEKLDAYLAHLPGPDEAAGGAIDATASGNAPSPAIAKALALGKRPLLDKQDAFNGREDRVGHRIRRGGAHVATDARFRAHS